MSAYKTADYRDGGPDARFTLRLLFGMPVLIAVLAGVIMALIWRC